MFVNNKSTKNTKAPKIKLDIVDIAKLTAYDGNRLQYICNILTPLEKATHYTQGENIVTSSYIVTCVIVLTAVLNNVHSGYNNGLITILKILVKNRLIQFESRPMFRLSPALDPRYKLQFGVPGSGLDRNTCTIEG